MLPGGVWRRAGIRHISDIFYDGTGRCLSHPEIAAKHNTPCSFLDLLKIRMSIPLHWRRKSTDRPAPLPLQQSGFEVRIHDQELVDISAIGAKATYSLLIEGENTVSTAYLRWTEDREEITLNKPRGMERYMQVFLPGDKRDQITESALQGGTQNIPLWIFSLQNQDSRLRLVQVLR